MAKRRAGQGAVALQYDPQHNQAPQLTAKGRGPLAERLIEIARQNDVPIRQDPDLVEILCQLDLNTEIPPEVYRAVAEILAFVYQTGLSAGPDADPQSEAAISCRPVPSD